MSFNLYLSSQNFPSQNSANLEYTFNPPLTLSGEWEVACVGGKLVNSVPNVSSSYSNNVFRYSIDAGVTWRTVTLPEGTYQTTALETELQTAMVAYGDYTVVDGSNVYAVDFKANTYLLRFQVTLKANAQIDLSIGEFYKLLGFSSPRILDGGVSGASFVAENIALFTTGGEVFYVQTDIVKGGMNVGNGVMTLAGVIRAVESEGLGVVVQLRDASGDYPYFRLNANDIRSFRVRVYDNLNRIANFRGEGTTFNLRFRKVQN